jgi:hypothetical protein
MRAKQLHATQKLDRVVVQGTPALTVPRKELHLAAAVILRRGPHRRGDTAGCSLKAEPRYWTMVHPGLEIEDDVRDLMSSHKELAYLLLQDPDLADTK